MLRTWNRLLLSSTFSALFVSVFPFFYFFSGPFNYSVYTWAAFGFLPIRDRNDMSIKFINSRKHTFEQSCEKRKQTFKFTALPSNTESTFPFPC